MQILMGMVWAAECGMPIGGGERVGLIEGFELENLSGWKQAGCDIEV